MKAITIDGTVTLGDQIDASGSLDVPAFKIAIGTDGIFDGFVSLANPLPVAIVSGVLPVSSDVSDRAGRLLGHVTVDNFPGGGGLTDAQLRASPVPVDGSSVTQPISAAALPLPSGASTASGVAAVVTRLGDGSTHVIVDSLPAGGGGLTDAELRASPVPVSGTFYQGTQPISAAALPLPSGASTASKQDTGNASLASIDGKLPVALVGGKFSVTLGLTDAELRASPIPVSGTFYQATQPVSVASLPLPSGAATDAGLAAIYGRQADGSQHAVIDSSALPAGAATSAKQDTGNASLASLDGKAPALVSGRVPVDGSGVTQPVSAASLPLPSGAATSALQTTGNTSLASIDGKLPASLVGGKLSVTIGLTDAELRASPVPVSLVAGSAVIGKVDQGTGGASAWKVDGSSVTQPISAVALPLPAGAATSAKQDTGNTSLASIDGKIVAVNTGAVVLAAGAATIGKVDQGAGGASAWAVKAPNVLSTANTTAVALGSGATFTGTSESLLDYPELSLNVYGAPSTATGTLYFEFSPDGANWDVSVPVPVDDPTLVVPLALRSVLPFFRTRYVNGAIAQTAFRLTTLLHRTGPKNLTRTIAQTIDDQEPVEMVRSIISGKQPGGAYNNLFASGPVTTQETTTPLGIAGVFTGTEFTPCVGFAEVSCTISTDQQSASNGITFQFSADGVTVQRIVSFTFGAAEVISGSIFVSLPIEGDYVRVRYTNGTVAQGSFRVNTVLSAAALGLSRSSIESTINGASSAAMVRANLNAKSRSSGTYSNLQQGANGGLDVGIVQADVPLQIKSCTTMRVEQVSGIGTGAAVQLDSTKVSGVRKSIEIRALNANGNAKVYVYPSAGATTGNGRELVANEPVTWEIDGATDVYAIGSTSGLGVCVTQIGDTV